MEGRGAGVSKQTVIQGWTDDTPCVECGVQLVKHHSVSDHAWDGIGHVDMSDIDIAKVSRSELIRYAAAQRDSE